MQAKPPRRPPLKIGSQSAALPPSESVLLLVDFINPLQFEGAKHIASNALQAARRTARLQERMRRDGAAVIYANDNFGAWRSDFRALVAHCVALPGEPGDMARLLAPGAHALAVLKPRHSAFYATPLELLLSQMGTKSLTVCGLAADVCVQITAMDAYQRGFHVRVPRDGTAAESPERLAAALDYMERVLRCDTAPIGDEAP